MSTPGLVRLCLVSLVTAVLVVLGLSGNVFGTIKQLDRGTLHFEKLLEIGDKSTIGRIEDAWVLDSGELYILDNGFNKIHRFSPDGEYVGAVGREGNGPGEFSYPMSIAVGNDGKIFIGDMYGKVIVIQPDGTPWNDDFVSRSGRPMRDITIDREGNLYFSKIDLMEQKLIHKYSPEGELLSSFGDSYAVGSDIDTRVESVYAGAKIAYCSTDEILFLQMALPMVKIFDLSGKLRNSVDIWSDILPDVPEPKVHGGSITFTSTASGFVIDDLESGRFITEIALPNENGRTLVHEVYDLANRKVYSRSTKVSRLLCAGKNNSVYMVDEEEDGFIIVKYKLRFEK